MIGILVVTHGMFAEGLLNAVELIAGKQEKVEVLGLHHGDGIDEFEQRVSGAYDRLEDGSGVIILTDILGGSPSNITMKLLSERNAIGICGVNMAMLVQAIMYRDDNGLQELEKICIESASGSIISLGEKVAQMSATVWEEDVI